MGLFDRRKRDEPKPEAAETESDQPDGEDESLDGPATLYRTTYMTVVPAGDDGGGLVVGQNPPGDVTRGDLDMWRFDAQNNDPVAISTVKIFSLSPNFFFKVAMSL